MLAVHKRVLERLKRLAGKARLVLFGSVARGDFSEDSDIDVAVYGWDEETKRRLLDEADRIWLDTGLNIHLVFMTENSSPFLLKAIEEEGVEI